MCVYFELVLYAFCAFQVPKKPEAKSLNQRRAEIDVLVQGLIGPAATTSQAASEVPDKVPAKQDVSGDGGTVVEVTTK